MKNKKLIIGLTLGLCGVALCVLLVTLFFHKEPTSIIEDPSQAEIIDNEQTNLNEQEHQEIENNEEIDNKEENNELPGVVEDPESLPQYVEWLPALTNEELEKLGENDVLHDKYWLNSLHDANEAYVTRRHPGDLKSISIYYLEDARVAFFIFETDKTEYIIRSDTSIYEYTRATIDYYATLSEVNLDELNERGFKLIHVLNEENYPEIIKFFNDAEGSIYSDTEYSDLIGLMIKDL